MHGARVADLVAGLGRDTPQLDRHGRALAVRPVGLDRQRYRFGQADLRLPRTKDPVGVGHPGEPIGQRLGVEAEVRAQAELHSLPEGQLPADRVAVLGPAGGVGEPDTDRWQFDVFTGSGR